MQELSLSEWRHLQRRAGFGPGIEAESSELAVREKEVKELFDRSRDSRAISMFDFSPKAEARMKDMNPEARKKIRQQRRDDLVNLNLHWLEKMATDKAQLREKLTFFWHGHFACHVDHPFGMQHLNNLMRRLAMGNFRELLLEVSRHPAMLQYLNNRQNRKRHPNENFARELMELFTLGRGNYTENDVKEAARAFTGWNFDQEGQFVFRKGQHDFGSKTFRGKTGSFDGEDIIDLILEDKQTARHLSTKLYRFFVNDQPDPAPIEELASVLFDNDYHIGTAMEHLLMADWFYSPKNMAAKIKSPVELLTGLMRQLDMELPAAKPVTGVQKILGQVLFHPPNVAGWPGGRSWIDSSTLLLRMTLPRVIILASEPDFAMPGDLMDSGERKAQLRQIKKFEAKINWKAVERQYKSVPDQELTRRIVENLLPIASKTLDLALMDRFTDHSDRSSHIQSLYLQILSLPEYQLT
jgi:uncharacterized protein (DUF1800 family)